MNIPSDQNPSYTLYTPSDGDNSNPLFEGHNVPMDADAPLPPLTASGNLPVMGETPLGWPDTDMFSHYSPAQTEFLESEDMTQSTSSMNGEDVGERGVKMLKIEEDERAPSHGPSAMMGTLDPVVATQSPMSSAPPPAAAAAAAAAAADPIVATQSPISSAPPPAAAAAAAAAAAETSTAPAKKSTTLSKDMRAKLAAYKTPADRGQAAELSRILDELVESSSKLDELGHLQQLALIQATTDGLNDLLVEENKMILRLKEHARFVREMEEHSVLTPSEMKQMQHIRRELDYQMEQTTLYINEASEFLNPSLRGKTSLCCASLILTDSPFPLVLSKSKLIEKPLRVRLVRAARQEFDSTSNFTPITVVDQASRVPVPNVATIQKVDVKPDGSADIKVRVVNGSRMLPVRLKCSLGITYPGGSLALETLPSRPFVVTTNESQYEEGNGVLLQYLAFENATSTTWAHFANVLHEHMLRVTKQIDAITEDPKSMTAVTATNVPARIMSIHELEYIHNRFFRNQDTVSVAQFDEFWKWFGKMVVRMRSTKHIASMWREGLLWAFSTKAEIESALMDFPPGTFVARFSETSAGRLAIAYRAHDVPIRHYMLQVDEISLQKTFADYLVEVPDLLYVLRVLHNDYGATPLPPFFVRVSKETALRPFCTSREKSEVTGYDSKIGQDNNPSKPPPS